MPEIASPSRAVYCILYIALAMGALLPGLLGCASTSGAKQFEPLPQARVGASTLEPVAPRAVTDLLRDAEAAFIKANEAQEQGDHEAALRHYTLMLELLIDADLDPAIFYSLRNEFGAILDNTSKQAALYVPRQHRVGGEFRPVVGTSEIEVPFPLPERVLVEIEEIQQRYPKNFQTGLNRAQKYLPHIYAEYEKAGLPRELAWVAMVESQFTPKIVSRAGAGGMWQFMRTSGRRFNLRQDHYVDQRYDWQSATRASIAYFRYLYKCFDGDWALAISAYNMGEGGLERAIASNGGERNLWELIETPPASLRIRRETKKYYPRFLATLIVTSNPERYGFKVTPQAAENTVRMPVKGMYALDDIDKAMGYSSGTLARLNPDLLRELTPPTGEYAVAIPAADRSRFAAALKKTSQVKSGTGTHKVRRGETVSHIASRYGVSQRELMALNGVRSARSLRAGATLRIPGYHGSASGSGPAPSKGGGTYKVRPGDTLFEIAKAHGTSVKQLQGWNNLRTSRIRPGDKLHVGKPSAGTPRVRSGGATRYHVVRGGEYPAKIARMYNVPLNDFLAWNKLSKTSMIRVGDKLEIRDSNGASGAPPPSGPKTTHTVAKGEVASTIAKRYGVSTSDFLKWNGLTPRSVLHVGDKYVVYGAGGAPAASGAAPAQTARANTPAPEERAEAQAETNTTIHTVAKGHNPTTIARRYGVRVSDLYKWNNWPKRHVLHIGDKVVIQK